MHAQQIADRVTVQPISGYSAPINTSTTSPVLGVPASQGGAAEPSQPNPSGPTPQTPNCRSCTSNSVQANQWFENLLAQGTASFSATSGTSEVALPDKFNMSWQSSDQELHLVSTDSYVIGVFLRTFDPSCDSIRAIYLTLPDGRGRETTTYPLLLAQPVSWMALPEGGSALGTADDNRFAVRVDRVGVAAWRIGVTINPGGPGGEPWLSDASFSISASTFLPPWKQFALRIAAHSPSGTVQANGQFSAT